MMDMITIRSFPIILHQRKQKTYNYYPRKNQRDGVCDTTQLYYYFTWRIAQDHLATVTKAQYM